MRYSFFFILSFFILVSPLLSCKIQDQKNKSFSSSKNSQAIKKLKKWLSKSSDNRSSIEDLPFSKIPLSKNETETVVDLLLKDKQARMMKDYGKQWDEREISFSDLKMPFYYQKFGEEPPTGRSLYISLHGGGGAPSEVNDQQYENQKHLYDNKMKTLEGVYLAPRAPSNTWDLWHQNHIDDFLNIIIQMAIIKENVNPDKIYLIGYSAGGDGVFQLAPRMADRWAGASMMAGHPNETSPLGLKNTPFAIHMGALDAAYDRNLKAKEWKLLLDDLESKSPGTYIHDVQLHKDMGHWMKLKDALALSWLKNYERNSTPSGVVWLQDNRHHETFYWLGTLKEMIKDQGVIKAEYNSMLNEINIIENYSEKIQLFVNDKMLDLDKPISIKYQGKIIYEGKLSRTILNTYKSMELKGDDRLCFSAMASIINNNEIEK